MFSSVETFSIFFFTSLGLIILGIMFEDKLIAIEEKIEIKRKERKK